MRPQAHIAAGLLVWSSAGGPLWEAPLAVAASNLPDIDRNVAKRLGVERRDHHHWVSHSFVGWAPPTALVLRASRSAVARRAALNLWGHLALDTYHDGLAWLWPVYRRKIGLFQRPPGVRDKGWHTPARIEWKVGKVEAALWAGVATNLALRAAGR